MQRTLLDPGKLVAAAVLLGCCALVVALFLWMVGPAAAREVTSACNGMRPTWKNNRLGKIPAQVPDFELKNLDGETVKLSDYRGKIVLLNFWASWCGTCKAEKRALAAMTRELGDDVQVVTIASDTDPAEGGAIDHSLRLSLNPGTDASARLAGPAWGDAPFEVLLDPPLNDETDFGPTATRWGITAFPESFVIDRNGVARMYIVNKRDWTVGVVETCLQSFIDE
jgi:thiol-disulfide isomerase/thioredoxin